MREDHFSVERPAAGAPEAAQAGQPQKPSIPAAVWQRREIVPLLVLAGVVTVLFLTAPYHKDMWWSDAPRHAMDGAFYRDFARHMPLAHVKQFAMDYYLKYPALTILFYPPLFPLVEGGFFAVFGVSLFSAQLTVSVFYVALAWGSYILCRRWMDRGAALAVALLFIGARETALWGRQVMLEIPACAFLVWSAVFCFQYLDRRKPIWAYGLALGLAGGAYTKQTVLFIVPALIWTMWRRWGSSIFRDRHLWASAALFCALVLPLGILNLTVGQLNVRSVVGTNWSHTPIFSWAGWTLYARTFPSQVNWVVTALAAAGLALCALFTGPAHNAAPPGGEPGSGMDAGSRPTGGTLRKSRWGEGESFFGLWLLAGYVFFSLIALKEPRHTVPILLPLAYFAVTAIRLLTPARAVPVLALGLAAASFGETIWRHPTPYLDGYGSAADYVAVHAPRRSVILFSGYRDGAFTFDVRRRVDRPDLRVLRADKLLLRITAQRELGLEELKVSEPELLDMINRFGVSYIVNQPNFWDDLKNMQELQHVLQSPQFRKVAVITVLSNVDHSDRQLEIYQNLGPVVTDRKERIRLDLPIVGMHVEGTLGSTDSGIGAGIP